MNNLDERLLELARLRQDTAAQTTALKATRDALFAEHIAPLDDAAKAAQAALDDAERALRDELLAYITETGDKKPHPAVTLRRDKKLVYDKDAVVAELLERGERGYLRQSLIVRDFEKAVRDGTYATVLAEEVPAPTVVIGGLGDLLIHAENEVLREQVAALAGRG